MPGRSNTLVNSIQFCSNYDAANMNVFIPAPRINVTTSATAGFIYATWSNAQASKITSSATPVFNSSPAVNMPTTLTSYQVGNVLQQSSGAGGSVTTASPTSVATNRAIFSSGTDIFPTAAGGNGNVLMRGATTSISTVQFSMTAATGSSSAILNRTVNPNGYTFSFGIAQQGISATLLSNTSCQINVSTGTPAAPTTRALPTTAVVGSFVLIFNGSSVVADASSGNYRITQAAGQYIRVGNSVTTVGTSGYLQTDIGQILSMMLVCIEANVGFAVVAQNVGNFIIV